MKAYTNRIIIAVLIAAVAMAFSFMPRKKQPYNVLIFITDDQSAVHTNPHFADGKWQAYSSLNTPGFARLAKEGVVFNQAYASSPSCTPSRGSLLTGRYHWSLGHASVLHGGFPQHIPTLFDVLNTKGYATGFTGKGWGPGKWDSHGRQVSPCGPEYNTLKAQSAVPIGASTIDYAANFKAFLMQNKGKPFGFWMGPYEPHRAYGPINPAVIQKMKSLNGDGGIHLDPLVVPPHDLASYLIEIEHADKHLVQALHLLDSLKLTENTIIIFTSDNGMPFPGAKATLTKEGLHVPLTIYLPKELKEKQAIINTPVSHIDLLPTLFDYLNLPLPDTCHGLSLRPLMQGKPLSRKGLGAGLDRHAFARQNNVGYPGRAWINDQGIYVWHPEPNRTPVGDLFRYNKKGDLMDSLAMEDIDAGPAKDSLKQQIAKHKNYALYYTIAGPRPQREWLPFKSSTPMSHGVKQSLDSLLTHTGDPRMLGNPHYFDNVPNYTGQKRWFNKP